MSENGTILSEQKSTISRLEGKLSELSANIHGQINDLKERFNWKDAVRAHPVLAGLSVAVIGFILGRKRGRLFRLLRALSGVVTPVAKELIQDILTEKLQQAVGPVVDEFVEHDESIEESEPKEARVL